MQYENYRERMYKIASVEAWIRTHILVFVIIGVVLLACAVTSCSLKGVVYRTADIPSEIVYGEMLSCESSAFFSDVSYEFASLNQENWSRTMPKRAGMYRVRTVSERMFGIPNYGKAYTVTIHPRPIDVAIATPEVEYGSLPELTADLAHGDSLVCDVFHYDSLSQQTTEAYADPDAIRIYDEQNVDVSDSYQITAVKSLVTFLSRSIEVTLGDAERVYDGTPLTCMDMRVTSGSLVQGDMLFASFDASLTQAGQIANTAQLKIANADGADVTGRYAIRIVEGKLTVIPRPITIYTATAQRVYDGTPLTSPDYVIDPATPLIDGHKIELAEFASQTNVGNCTNKLSFKITFQGEDVTQSYAFSFPDEGTLTVTKREILVRSHDAEKVYDGVALTADGFTVASAQNLVEGHVLTVLFSGSQTLAGQSQNTIKSVSVAEQGELRTDNYDFLFEYGSLVVNKRPLNIQTESMELLYDATAQSHGVFAVSNLVEGQTARVIEQTLTWLTDVEWNADGSGGLCEHQNTFEVSIFSGSNNVTQSYDISYTYGTVTMRPRPITVVTADASWVYDGIAHTADDFRVEDYGLAATHTAAAEGLVSITDVGNAQNAFVVRILDGERDVSFNYAIVYRYGTLDVTHRPVTITTNSTSWVYDGMAHADDGFVVTGDGLAASQSAQAVGATPSTVEVGSISNVFAVIITDAGLRDVTHNYSIEYVYGTLTITPRNIIVTTESNTWVYDGMPHADSGFMVGGDGLAPNQTAQEVTSTSHTHVGSVDNVFAVAITDAGLRDVTHNYSIEYVYGTLTITPRNIIVTTESNTWVYDGMPHTDSGFIVGGDGLAPSQTAQAIAVPAITNVGSLENVFTVTIFDSSLVEVTTQYNIVYDYGTLAVTARPITVTTESNTWVYDGMPHTDSGFTVGGDGLAPHQTAYAIAGSSITSAGSLQNVFTIDIRDVDFHLVTHNYDVTYVYGTLAITTRQITVATDSNTWLYDGQQHADLEFVVSGDGLAPNQTAQAAFLVTIVDAGSVDNAFAIRIEDNAYRDVTRNYSIAYIYGTLTVTKRVVTVTTHSETWLYSGASHACPDFSVDGDGLAAGQTARANAVLTIKDVGTLENVFSITITGANSAVVTHNYTITYVYGTLTVTPLKVAVKLTDAQKEYDGMPLISKEYTTTPKLVEVGWIRVEILVSGKQTSIGTSPNTITFFAIFEGYKDITENYSITFEDGTLEVTPRRLTVTAASSEKRYDGTPLSNAGFTAKNVVKGHTVFAQTIGSQTGIGQSSNVIDHASVRIKNALGEDVSGYYELHLEDGILTVYLEEITLTTGSSSKQYDGLPLTDSRYEIFGMLADGHHAVVRVEGVITEPGKQVNTAILTILDSLNRDVTEQYSVLYELGELEVWLSEPGDGGGTDDKNLDLSGNILDREDSAVGTTPLFTVMANYDGTLYLRVKSFGDYAGYGWLDAPVYSVGDINALYVTYLSLAAANMPVKSAAITPLRDNLHYMLPSYAQDGYLSLDDTMFQARSVQNVFSLIPYTYNASDSFTVSGTGYAAFEQAYYNHVLAAYLQLPEDVKAQLLEIAALNNLRADSPTIISDVASFVQTKVPYDTKASGYTGDVALHFFKKADGAVCAHYATAATAMLRALGIPARYTIGYAVQVQSGNTVQGTNKQAHAWVEVYIQGMGWVQLEVTASGEGSNSGGEDTEVEQTLVIKPTDVYKQYDGTPLYAKNEVQPSGVDASILWDSLLQKGYTYTAVVLGERTDFGESRSQIMEFVLYDPHGVNVTSQFEIEYLTGTVSITHVPIEIHLNERKKIYDGTPLSYEVDDYWHDGLPNGFTLNFLLSGSITDVGVLELGELKQLPYTVYNESMQDVTEGFTLVFVGKPLTVLPRSLTVATSSDQWVYDALPHQNEQYSIVAGSLVAGHTAQVQSATVVTEAGNHQNSLALVITDDVGRDVTRNYAIHYETGWLTITPRPLMVETASGEWVYDGTPHANPSCQLISGLVEGHAMSQTDYHSVIVDVGEVNNEIGIAVCDVLGNDVTHNYEVIYRYGTLKVTPLAITVQSASQTWMYDGEAHFNLNFTIEEGLVLQQTAQVRAYASITDAGVCANEIAIAIYDGTRDVTFNYDITYVYGTLTVTKRDAVVYTGSQTWIYDGQPHFDTSHTIDSYELPAGFISQLHPNSTPSTLTNVGQMGNVFEVAIYDRDGLDATHNFTVTYVYGTIAVTPLAVTIRLADATKVYDGTPLTSTQFEAEPMLAMVDGLRVEIAASGLQTRVGVSTNTVLSFEVFAYDQDISYNYIFTFEDGLLEVTPRPVEIRAGSAEKVYDGTDLTFSRVFVTGILIDHMVEATVEGVQREPGQSPNVVVRDSIVIRDADGEDVTDCYDITLFDGILRVLNVDLILKTAEDSKYYDGTPLTNDGYEIVGDLKDGHTAVVSVEGVITEVGEIENYATIQILDEFGSDVTDMYCVVYEFGWLTVKNPNPLLDGKVDKEGGSASGGGGGGGGGGNIEFETVLLYNVVSEVDATLYFRLKSFGDYASSGWLDAESYTVEEMNMLSLYYHALLRAGKQTHGVRIEPQLTGQFDIRPYYVAEYGSNNDTQSGFGTGGDYQFINYTYDAADTFSLSGSTFDALEQAYRAFVQAKYLQLPDGLQAQLLAIAEQNGLDEASPSVIADVAQFVQNKVLYGKNFSYENDIALEFFTTAKESLSAHFATAATTMLRALGVPARVTVGYTVDAKAGEVAEVYGDLHYWVEAYVAGAGWVQVEVTSQVPGSGGGGGSGGSGGGKLDTGGDINAGGGGDGEPHSADPLFMAKADYSGLAYFRVKSFGDYAGSTWSDATAYNGQINPLYLTHAALTLGGAPLNRIEIEPRKDDLHYMLPYYAKDGYLSSDDTTFQDATCVAQTSELVVYNYNAANTFSLKDTEYAAFEQAYYEHVLASYLALPSEDVKNELLDIAAQNNLRAKSPTVISDVASYVQGLVTYDLNVEQYEGDAALYFFTKAQTAVCRHYATAATAMLRALGIPARYTIGYAAQMSKGVAIAVTGAQAHAWVEVYIKGMGWVQLEVTGSGEGSPTGGGGGGGGQDDSPEELVIKPMDVYKQYDGTPLVAAPDIEGSGHQSATLWKALMNDGCRYTATVSGSRTEFGESESVIEEFVLYDVHGANITDRYAISFQTGSIRILNQIVQIHLYELAKTYDGTPLSYESGDYWAEGLPSGHRLDFDLVGSLTDVGELERATLEALPYRIYDASGVDVSEAFSLVFEGKMLRIDQAVIRFTSMSATKRYDGQPLTDHRTWVSTGDVNCRYTAAVTGTITDVGSVENKFTVTIFDTDGNTITNNYAIEYEFGKLTITNA